MHKFKDRLLGEKHDRQLYEETDTIDTKTTIETVKADSDLVYAEKPVQL